MSHNEHEIVTSNDLPAPIGYAHAVVAASGRTVLSWRPDGSGPPTGPSSGRPSSSSSTSPPGTSWPRLHAAGGQPDDLVSLQIFVTDLVAYRASMADLGGASGARISAGTPRPWRCSGSLELFDPGALVELVGVAVIPWERHLCAPHHGPSRPADPERAPGTGCAWTRRSRR